jgi:hypothetical protein
MIVAFAFERSLLEWLGAIIVFEKDLVPWLNVNIVEKRPSLAGIVPGLRRLLGGLSNPTCKL